METDREHTSGEARRDDVRRDDEMTAVFSSSNHDAELEAMAVKGVLDSSGIPAMVVGPHVLPNLEFQVQVPSSLESEAREYIRAARQGGREAADEAEAMTDAAGGS